MTNTITITKLDAARRQLLTAIELWFADGDPVSIHTLARASHEIIHRLFRLKGETGLLFDSTTLIAPEHREAFLKFIKDSANFFKHAKIERNPVASIDFNTDLNALFMSMSIVGLDRIGEPRGDEESAFMFWLALHRPALFTEDLLKENVPGTALAKLRRINKRDFFEEFLAAKRIPIRNK